MNKTLRVLTLAAVAFAAAACTDGSGNALGPITGASLSAASGAGIVPILVPGNLSGTAADICSNPAVTGGATGWLGHKVDGDSGGTFAGFQVTVTDGKYLAWTSLGSLMRAVVMKGGPDTYVYRYPPPPPGSDTGLRSPDNEGGNVPNISHYTICYEVPPHDAKIEISPTETNGITEPHTFDVRFTAIPGSPASVTFNSISVVVLPAPGSLVSTCNTPTVVGNVATCSVTINSPVPGVFTANAYGSVTIGTTLLNRDTDPATATVAGPGGSGPAVKTYIDGWLAWSKNDHEGNRLGGATFEACRIEDRFGNVLSPEQCITVLDNSSADANPAAGEFRLNGLALGRWRLRETIAPAGYTLDPTDVRFAQLTLTAPSHTFAVAWVNVPRQDGCTPGFWKNHDGSGPQANQWPAGYSRTHLLSAHFTGNLTPYASNTLSQALDFGGGGGVDGAKRNLLRAAVAALLNAAHPEVNYPRTVDQVKSAVASALNSGNRTMMLMLAGQLDADNNLGCTVVK